MKSNKHIEILVCIALVVSCFSISSQTVSTNNLSVTINQSKIVSLENKLTKTIWTVNQDSLYQVLVTPANNNANITRNLSISGDTQNQIKLVLTITNTSSETIKVSTTFPKINGICISGRSTENLYYLYPKQGWINNNIDITHDNIYSRNFPLQFMDVYDIQNGGFYVMTNDTTNYPKRYYLSKKNGKINLNIKFQIKQLAPGETWVLPSVVIGSHKNDWHDAFLAYKNWVKTWYKPISPRKQWFQDVYNFRQTYLHTTFGEVGAWNPVTKKINLISKIEADKQAFGGVDFVHIFDWSSTATTRILDYDPWSYLGGAQELINQIKLIQDQDIKVGLYHEGYLMNKKSQIGLAHGTEWEQLNSVGQPYLRFGDAYYYPCPSIPGWQEFLSNLVNNSSTYLNSNGVYVDQYGFGFQYGCYNKSHNHPTLTDGVVSSNLQVTQEADMLKYIRSNLANDKVNYIEEMPTDVTTQSIDGSFSYSIWKCRDSVSHNPACVNLFRFALPNYKMFELYKVDNPVGNDTTGVKFIFFNGEGIWLEGPLNDSGWYPDEVRKLIRKTYSILIQNKEAFRSNDAIPLYPTLNDSVYSNYFPSERRSIWTFYNASQKKYSGDILKILHRSGSIYYDAWNSKALNVEIINGYAIIKIDINSKDIGCVIQSLDPIYSSEKTIKTISAKIYPTITKDMLFIVGSEEPILEFSIYDINGKHIIAKTQNSNSIDVRFLKAGMYILQLRDKNAKTTRYKFIKD